jgi:hypothetical protein
MREDGLMWTRQTARGLAADAAAKIRANLRDAVRG